MKFLTQFIKVDFSLIKVISVPLSNQLLLTLPLRILILISLEEAISLQEQQRGSKIVNLPSVMALSGYSSCPCRALACHGHG